MGVKEHSALVFFRGASKQMGVPGYLEELAPRAEMTFRHHTGMCLSLPTLATMCFLGVLVIIMTMKIALTLLRAHYVPGTLYV